MRESLFESIVGLVVVAVAGVFLVFSMNQRSEAAPRDSYVLTASFDRVDGIGVGSEVRVAGKKVGVVSSIDLDPTTYRAVVDFTLPNTIAHESEAVEFRIPDDSTAQIVSDGLLGGAYVSIMIGGSFETLLPGDQLQYTNSPVDLLSVLAAFADGGAAGE